MTGFRPILIKHELTQSVLGPTDVPAIVRPISLSLFIEEPEEGMELGVGNRETYPASQGIDLPAHFTGPACAA